jgi:ureidoglycolate lyase
MKRIPLKELALNTFLPYGTYTSLSDPQGIKIGDEPIEFFRDLIQVNLGVNNSVSLSSCRIFKRPPIIDVTECHSSCGEGLLSLDGDIAIHVGPATPNGEVPLDRIEAFVIPKGTFVSLRPGVWHHAPFTMGGKPVNVLVVLPERTYANDCTVHKIEKKHRLKIQGI